MDKVFPPQVMDSRTFILPVWVCFVRLFSLLTPTFIIEPKFLKIKGNIFDIIMKIEYNVAVVNSCIGRFIRTKEISNNLPGSIYFFGGYYEKIHI